MLSCLLSQYLMALLKILANHGIIIVYTHNEWGIAVMKPIKAFIISIISVFCLTGCSISEVCQLFALFEDSDSYQTEDITVTTEPINEKTVTTTTAITTVTEPVTTTAFVISAPEFSLASIPEYSGNTYCVVNNNVPYFDEYTTDVFEYYSPLDSLGRCGTAYANICKELMPTEPRGEIGMIKPSGWHTVRYDGLVEGNYLYNRCHLIGYQLAGENANELNLITGTRYMNAEGMEPFESQIANYVRYNDNAHVLYRVTPVFEGNNLVANGVLMEAYSVEDSGKGIQFCVFCYNVQPHIGIDYATGDTWLIEETTEPETLPPIVTEPQEIIPDRNNTTEETSASYVLNTNTKKFHYPTCSSVRDMAEHNKAFYDGTRDEVLNMGYEPCKRCNP